MDIDSFRNLIRKIVEDARSLKDIYTDQIGAPVNYACIFSQSEEEYQSFLRLANEIGALIKETPSGPLFRIYLKTVSGKLQLLKVRKPDPTRLERGDADFTIADYPAFKEKYLEKEHFKLIPKDGFEMIELYDHKEPVRAYFSFPPLDLQLGILDDRIPLKNGKSESLEACKPYLGKKVSLVIDQPYGTSYQNAVYECNYGYIPNTVAPDGEGIDAYFIGPKEPLEKAEGVVIAIIHRLDDDDDKLIVVPEGVLMTDKEIETAVNFREKFFKHEIIR